AGNRQYRTQCGDCVYCGGNISWSRHWHNLCFSARYHSNIVRWLYCLVLCETVSVRWFPLYLRVKRSRPNCCFNSWNGTNDRLMGHCNCFLERLSILHDGCTSSTRNDFGI